MGDISKCTFSPRCPNPTEECKNQVLEMGLREINTDHYVDNCCVDCV